LLAHINLTLPLHYGGHAIIATVAAKVARFSKTAVGANASNVGNPQLQRSIKQRKPHSFDQYGTACCPREVHG